MSVVGYFIPVCSYQFVIAVWRAKGQNIRPHETGLGNHRRQSQRSRLELGLGRVCLFLKLGLAVSVKES
jgi:hypothetical protein